MNVFLVYCDRDFDWQADLPARAGDLVQDLGLNVVLNAMAGEDDFLLKVAQRAVLWSLCDRETIVYRQQALRDCVEHPDVIRSIYDLAVETLREEKKIFSWFSESPELNLHRAVNVLELLLRMLKRLRQIALEKVQLFSSPAFRRFFTMLLQELDDAYFAEINQHLQRLKFGRGVLISAGLGRGNAGIGFVLRRLLAERQRWLDLIPGLGDGRLWFEVHPRDQAGHQALSDLRARGINLVADALAQSTDHVLGFFVQLRAELAFYLGCLNLRAEVERRGCPTCLPDPQPVSAPRLHAQGLYDVGLALTLPSGVVANDIAADGRSLVVITGANQGGKSTFLRSVGLARLMMQAGMFVLATSFSADVAAGLFTHFKREEDETMTRGKLDEELSRMSRIVDHIRPGALLLCNESFASTNEREGSEIGQQVIGALNEAGVKVLLVTHLFELAQRLRREAPDGVLFLRAERLPDGTRTFKIREGEPLPTAFGKDVYDEIFRDGWSSLSSGD